MTWQEVALRDCVTFLSGGTPSKRNAEYWKGDIPWVSSGEMTRQFINDTTLHISEVAAVDGSRLVPEGTIFVVVRGMSLATEFRVSYATRRMAFNQDLKGLLVKAGIDPYFLFSSLRAHANQIRELATEAAHGTKKLEMERLESFRIKIPNITLQRQIAGVVRNYDDQIETNRRRIALLEESARLLYREWFVKLRFPGHESVKRQNGLPEGWRYDRLDQALFLQRGFDLPNSARKEGNVPVYASTGVAGFHNEAKLSGQGVVTGRSGTLGVVHYMTGDYWPLNTALWVKEFRIVTPIVAYFMLAELNLAQYNSGASVPTLDRKVVHSIEVLIPGRDVMEEFGKRVDSIFTQINTLQEMNKQTQAARDELLPKLMSGAIKV
ncbi:MAG: restriction endonuclease subunit S [Limisphaerales bacterium]